VTTATLPEMESATLPITKVSSRLLHMSMLKETPNPSSRLLLMEELSLLLSKLTRAFSSIILEVFLIRVLVERSLTMVLLLLGTPVMLGSLKTPGDLPGVRTDMLELLKTMQISVVSCHSQHTQFCDRDMNFHDYFEYLLNFVFL